MKTDVAIIGAGAAGLYAADRLFELSDASVLVLNNSERPGKKILISGGNRCNFTNTLISTDQYFSSDTSVLRRVLKSFGRDRALNYFSSKGLAFEMEDSTGKFFPASNRAADVLACLMQHAGSPRLTIRNRSRILEINPDSDRVNIRCEEEMVEAKALLIAAGGRSFPRTGSDGSIHPLLHNLGHTLRPCHPALVPLHSPDADLQALSGIALPVAASVKAGGTSHVSRDMLLFTHQGLSGPAVMNLSRSITEPGSKAVLSLSFLPERKEEEFFAELLRLKETHPAKNLENALGNFLPQRLAAYLAGKAGGSGLRLRDCSHKILHRLTEMIFHFRPELSGNGGWEKAEATAGGIPLAEVTVPGLRSRFHERIYFAGEVLDVDGRIGGYNFHWAWASAESAVQAMLASLRT